MGWKDILKGSPVKTEDNLKSNCPTKIPKIPKSEKSTPDFYDLHIRQAIDELNSRGVSLLDYPKATRHRAFVLEEKITQAANVGDRNSFLDYLEQWRGCFH